MKEKSDLSLCQSLSLSLKSEVIIEEKWTAASRVKSEFISAHSINMTFAEHLCAGKYKEKHNRTLL